MTSRTLFVKHEHEEPLEPSRLCPFTVTVPFLLTEQVLRCLMLRTLFYL